MVRAAGLSAPAIALGAAPAHAHSPVPGMEGFYVGLVHPFSTAPQALLMVGLGFLAGGLASRHAGWMLSAFLVAMLAGLLVGGAFDTVDPALLAAATAAGALAALAPGRLLPLALALGTLGGFLIGVVSLTDPGPMRDRVITTLGSFVGANLGLLYLFGLASWLRQRAGQRWLAVGLRVAAAWLGAVSMLMLALSIAPDAVARPN